MKQSEEDERLKLLAEESSLVEQAKAGDTEAFGQLYEASLDRVYQYIFFRVPDEQSAEDLTSQVFLKAWEKLDQYRPRSPFLAWLYAIARNSVVDHYRSQRPAVALDDVAPVRSHEAGPDTATEQKFELESLRLAILQLTAEQQEVLILKFIAEFNTEEVARHMGKTQGAVRALQMRALQALAKIIGTDGQRKNEGFRSDSG